MDPLFEKLRDQLQEIKEEAERQRAQERKVNQRFEMVSVMFEELEKKSNAARHMSEQAVQTTRMEAANLKKMVDTRFTATEGRLRAMEGVLAKLYSHVTAEKIEEQNDSDGNVSDDEAANEAESDSNEEKEDNNAMSRSWSESSDDEFLEELQRAARQPIATMCTIDDTPPPSSPGSNLAPRPTPLKRSAKTSPPSKAKERTIKRFMQPIHRSDIRRSTR